VLGLPDDGFGQLLPVHGRQRDFLDDHRVAGYRDGHVPVLELVLVEDHFDRFDNGGGVDDRSFDDSVMGEQLVADPDDFENVPVPLLLGSQLDRLDRMRADVQSDDPFVLV
jgi:hypothetical protein